LRIDKLTALVFDAPDYKHDAIVGRNFMLPNNFDIKLSTRQMEWYYRMVPMKDAHSPEIFCFDFDDNADDEDPFDVFAADILPSRYAKMDVETIIKQQEHHLDAQQHTDLQEASDGMELLFSGKLGCYKKRKIDLELQLDAIPVHSKAFPVPVAHKKVFVDECWHLVEQDVLAPVGLSQHAYPTFIIPKKDGRVCWVSEFRKLNEMLACSTYPLPRIQDILTRRSGYKFFTKIDISMQYYTFELTDRASYWCAIVTPFGKFRYKCLPMGVTLSPDIAQQIMNEIFEDMEKTEVYLDDIGVFSND
jgi:hypothetical protein